MGHLFLDTNHNLRSFLLRHIVYNNMLFNISSAYFGFSQVCSCLLCLLLFIFVVFHRFGWALSEGFNCTMVPLAQDLGYCCKHPSSLKACQNPPQASPAW